MADATLKMILLGQDRGASRAIKGVGDQAERTETKSSKMGAAFSKSGRVAGKVLAGGLLLAGAAAVKAGKAAADDEAAQSKLAQTLRTGAHATDGQIASTEKWITAQGKALGVADDDLRPALGKLAVATGDVGKAQKLASLGMDIAAGSGKDLGAVTQALAKAQSTGSVTALAKYGVATKDASGKVKTLSAITKELAEKYQGAAAKAADTTAGKQKKLTLQMGELQEQIGAGLLPIMAKLATAGLAAIDWMSKHETTVKILAGVIGGLVGTLWLVSKAMAAVNLVMSLNPIGLVVIAIAALVAGLVIAYKKSETFRKIVDGAMHAVGRIILWLWNNAYQPAMKGIVTAIGWVLKAIGKMLSALGHIPGFGWAKKAGDAMQSAGNKAIELADGIKKIKSKSVTVKVTYREKRYSSNSGIGGADQYSYHNAVGTSFWRGGGTMVGERGRAEYAEFPRGTKITPDSQMRRASSDSGDLGTLNVVVRSEDGRVLERKLAKLKRSRGNLRLEFEKV